MKTKHLLIRAANCLGSENKELDNWAREVICDLASLLQRTRTTVRSTRLPTSSEEAYTDHYYEIIAEEEDARESEAARAHTEE